MAQTTLYARLVSVSQDYLGPAAERFVRRQILMHIEIEPEEVQKKDVAKLITWIQPAFALLTDDAVVIAEFSRRLEALAQNGMPPKKRKSSVVR